MDGYVTNKASEPLAGMVTATCWQPPKEPISTQLGTIGYIILLMEVLLHHLKSLKS